jgi:hypothetical protein
VSGGAPSPDALITAYCHALSADIEEGPGLLVYGAAGGVFTQTFNIAPDDDPYVEAAALFLDALAAHGPPGWVAAVSEVWQWMSDRPPPHDNLEALFREGDPCVVEAVVAVVVTARGDERAALRTLRRIRQTREIEWGEPQRIAAYSGRVLIALRAACGLD